MPMDTEPIRIRKADKERVEELRLEIQRSTGRRLSQQELVARAFDFTLRHKDQFVHESTWKPLTAAEVKHWLGKPFHLGKWSSTDIDDIVHGSKP